jgi:uncharacterized protein involved in exopolysaccharide biosynthesis
MDLGNLIDDILGVLRRRWLVILLPLCIGLPLTGTIALLLPSTYASTARIIVESQQIPDELAQSTVPQSAGERIQLLQQRLLSRQTLLEIADQYNVFAGRPDMSPTAVVEQMRRATRITDTGSGRGRRGRTVTGVDISFRAASPVVAAQVSNEFVTRILAENVEDRTNRAANTLAFFDQEVERLATALEALSAEITQLKVDNQNALPQTLVSRQSELSELRDQRFDRIRERAALEEQKRVLEEAVFVGRTSIGPANQLSPEESELIRLRSTLLQQRATLAPTHPTIRQLTARIDALESAITPAVTEAEGATGSGTTGAATNLLAQIEAIDLQIELLDNQRDAAEARIAELEDSIARTPEIEMRLDALERNRESLATQYRQAILRQSQAETGERLEASQQGERFEVIEQAVPNPQPVAPNRPMIVAAGFAASIAISGGLTLLLELLYNVIRTARDLERQVSLRPIVSIPYLVTDEEQRRQRLTIRGLILAVVIALPLALLAIDQLFIPLAVLLDRVAERLQLSTILAPLEFSL